MPNRCAVDRLHPAAIEIAAEDDIFAFGSVRGHPKQLLAQRVERQPALVEDLRHDRAHVAAIQLGALDTRQVERVDLRPIERVPSGRSGFVHRHGQSIVVDQIIDAGVGDHAVTGAVGVDRGDLAIAEIVDDQLVTHQVGGNGNPTQPVVVEQHRFGGVVVALQRDTQHVGVIGSIEIGDAGQRRQRGRGSDTCMAGTVVGGISVGEGVADLHGGSQRLQRRGGNRKADDHCLLRLGGKATEIAAHGCTVGGAGLAGAGKAGVAGQRHRHHGAVGGQGAGIAQLQAVAPGLPIDQDQIGRGDARRQICLGLQRLRRADHSQRRQLAAGTGKVARHLRRRIVEAAKAGEFARGFAAHHLAARKAITRQGGKDPHRAGCDIEMGQRCAAQAL